MGVHGTPAGRIRSQRQSINKIALFLLVSLVSPLSAKRAYSQRADDNAVQSAEDAFGTQIDQQSIGLYSPTNVRGFSPQQAGNLRIDGLYFDQVTIVTNPCLIRDTTIRIGIAAQKFSFPAPSGIVDLQLRTPGDKEIGSLIASYGPFAYSEAALEYQLPTKDQKLGVDICAQFEHDFDYDAAQDSHRESFSVIGNVQPSDKIQITPFVAYVGGSESRMLPELFTGADTSLPPFRENQLSAQADSNFGWEQLTAGVVSAIELPGQWHIRSGIFYSRENDPANYNPYLLLDAQGLESFMDVTPPHLSTSLSGEVRAIWNNKGSSASDDVELNIRFRDSSKEFGGDDVVDYGPATLLDRSQFPAFVPTFSPTTTDAVDQVNIGATWSRSWGQQNSVSLGAMLVDYRRSIDTPGQEKVQTRESVGRVSAQATHELWRNATWYGSFIQGFEDSPVAPLVATNRGEPPLSSLTWQADTGIRLELGKSLHIVVGAYEIGKPWIAQDSAGVYVANGNLRSQGLEGSLAYHQDALTVIAGLVGTTSTVSSIPNGNGVQIEPLGTVPLTFTVNADFAPDNWRGFGVSSQLWRYSSQRVAYYQPIATPSLTTIGAGVRYQKHLTQGAVSNWSVRLDAFNLTNAAGLHLSNTGWVQPEDQRRIMLTLSADWH